MVLRPVLRPELRPVLRSSLGDFLPSDLAGLKLWARHKQGITVTGAGVSQWDDQSGNGNHLVQATDASRPLPATGVIGSELFSNSDFDSDTIWTKGGTATISGGEAHLPAASYVQQSRTTVVGQTYTINVNITTPSNKIVIRVGTGPSAPQQYDILNIGYLTTGGLKTYSFVATTTTTYATVLNDVSPSATLDVTSISLKKADPNSGIYLDGLADYLAATFTLNQPETIYFLGRQITWANGEYIFDGVTVGSGALYQSGVTPSVQMYSGAGVNPSTDFILDTHNVATLVFDGASSILQIGNNAPEGPANAGTANMGGFTLGARGGGTAFGNIQVKEIIVFNTAHDAVTRAKVIKYLAGVGALTI